MNTDDDPFGLMDSDRTQIMRPAPGGRAARPPSTVRRMPSADRSGATGVAGTPGRGPLVEYAFGLLTMLPLLRARTPPAPPEQLRAQIESDLRAFSERAQGRGLDQRMIGLAHYALCALIDDVVLNTPWGAHGTWQSSSLAAALHNDAAAGEHLFDYLNQARRQPEQNRPVLELISACLALGFEGQYRILPHGQVALQQIRNDLLTTLRRREAEDDGELSPHWRGAAAAHVPLARRIPVWVYGTAMLALLVVTYAAYSIRLGELDEHLGGLVKALPSAAPVSIIRDVGAVQPPTPKPPAALALGPRARICLPEPGRSAPDSVVENLQGLRVRLPNAGLFASGSADLQPAVGATIACLADLLKTQAGKVLVVGHSDNVPINTARFPSNRVLSLARAEAVAAVMRPLLPGRTLDTLGRADAEPLASNANEDARSRNRRVEILLVP